MRILHTPPRPRTNLPPMTALNREVNRLYRACERRGFHVPSGQLVIRDYMAVPHSWVVCARCGVPTRGSRVR